MSDLDDDALDRASPERLVELYLEHKANQRRVLRKHFEERLKSDVWRREMLDVLRTLLDRKARDADALRALSIRYDGMSFSELRTVVTSGTGGHVMGLAVFALVRGDQGAWLEEQFRAGALNEWAVDSLVRAAVNDRAMEKRVIRLARDVDDAVLLAHVLERFDVGRELVERGVASTHPRARAAAMPHAHRLRDTRTALRKGLKDPDSLVRRAALGALLERPDPALRGDVEKLVDDPDQYDERYNTRPIGTRARQFLKLVGGGE